MHRHQLLLLFPALMRSGHHAVIEWIQSHFGRPQFELNNAIAFAAPFRANWYEKHSPPSCDTVLATVNFEDVDITRCRKQPLIDINLLGDVECCKTILVLRDPYNLLASKLRFMRTRDWWNQEKERRNQTVNKILKLWVSMAREFAGETEFLGDGCVKVSFNQWFLSCEYRDAIAAEIGFENQDYGVDRVSQRGDGSSFDYQNFDGNAQQMGVLNRWHAMKDDKEFRRIFKDAEVARLSELLFGPLQQPESVAIDAQLRRA